MGIMGHIPYYGSLHDPKDPKLWELWGIFLMNRRSEVHSESSLRPL